MAYARIYFLSKRRREGPAVAGLPEESGVNGTILSDSMSRP